MLRWEKNLQRPVIRRWCCLILHIANKLNFLLNMCHHCCPSCASLHHLHQPIQQLAVTRQHLHPGWLGAATPRFDRSAEPVQLNEGKAQQGFISEERCMRCTFKWQRQNRMQLISVCTGGLFSQNSQKNECLSVSDIYALTMYLLAAHTIISSIIHWNFSLHCDKAVLSLTEFHPVSLIPPHWIDMLCIQQTYFTILHLCCLKVYIYKFFLNHFLKKGNYVVRKCSLRKEILFYNCRNVLIPSIYPFEFYYLCTGVCTLENDI